MKITKALITGGSGFIGSHLAEYFIRSNVPVICVDNFATGLRSNIDYLKALMPTDLFTFAQADVCTDQSNWTKGLDLSGLSHVFHFASPASPPHYQRLNLETMWVNSVGLNQCLILADQYKARVIFASTSEVYGDPSVFPQPEEYWGNVNSFGERSCYDEAKRFGESLIFSHNQRHATKHGLVRIFNTYGPRMNPNDGRVIINFLVQALQNQALTVYGDGKQTRSFCFVDDLVAGIIKYASSDITYPVNLGNDIEFSINELAAIVCDIFKEQNLKTIYKDLPADDPKQRRPDLRKAKELLKDWAPRVQLKEGLQQMIRWMKQNPDLIK